MAGNEALPNLPAHAPEGDTMPLVHEPSAFERNVYGVLGQLSTMLDGSDDSRQLRLRRKIDFGLDLLNQYKQEHPDA